MTTSFATAQNDYFAKCERLKGIASELKAMTDGEGRMNAADTAIADALDAEATGLQTELQELRTKYPSIGRRTGPNAMGSLYSNRSGNGSKASDYCKLHGLQASELDDGGFRSMGEFLSVYASGMIDNRIIGMRAAAASKFAGNGGIMVPERFLAESLHPAGEDELIMPRARTYSMPGRPGRSGGVIDHRAVPFLYSQRVLTCRKASEKPAVSPS